MEYSEQKMYENDKKEGALRQGIFIYAIREM